jgi:thiamine-phosphate pyrophosphorylase
VRRYAITDRTLFPGSSQPADEPRVPHPSQSYREGWDSQQFAQLSALIRETAQWAADGIDYIQLREKDLPAADLANLARSILKTLCGMPAKLLINSRPDIAIATGAHGVHLTSAPGQLTPSQIRELYATAKLPPPIISVSCHTLAEVKQARHQADLILFAPVFQKSIAGQVVTPGQGLEALHAACLAAAPTPVFALGGVTPENAPGCLQAGAAGIAGIRLFYTS